MSEFLKKLGAIPKLPLLAILGLICTGVYLVSSLKPEEKIPPVRQPSQSPYQNTIAGVGIIEADDENLEIYPQRAERVDALYVREGDEVKRGQALFRLQLQTLQGAQERLAAEKAVADATLTRLKKQPRPEDITPLRWSLTEAETAQKRLQESLKRMQAARNLNPNAVSQEEYQTLAYQVQEAVARRHRLQAELDRAEAGAWEYELKEAEAQSKLAQARIGEQQVLINQSTVRAPRDGMVLQVNIRPGEYVTTTQSVPPVVMGRTRTLQVRVDVDENNASLVRPGMEAVAYIKGDSTRPIKELAFVRIEPYMVPKRNLTGANTERVDVRVLQLVYRLTPREDLPLYVGQQVDVYLKRPQGVKLPAGGARPEAPAEGATTPLSSSTPASARR